MTGKDAAERLLEAAVLSTAESYAADQAAAAAGVAGITLMENAGHGVAEAIRARWQPQPVLALCGPGNNGGDGFAAARHLANSGMDVRLHLTLPPDAYRTGSDPAVNLRIAEAMGVAMREDCELQDAALVVDAVFGTGLARTVRAPYRDAIDAIAAAPAPVVAIDLPSGLDANTGAVLGTAVGARVVQVDDDRGRATGVGDDVQV